MPEKYSVSVADATIEYEVVHSARRKKTIELKVDMRGAVVVRAPAGASAEAVRDFVLAKSSWVLRKQQAALQAPARPSAGTRLVSGEMLPFLGRDLCLSVQPTADRSPPSVQREEDRLLVCMPCMPLDTHDDDRYEHTRSVIVEWYRARADFCFNSCVDEWLPKLWDGPRPRVIVSNARRQWGSCSHDGTLRITWRAMMLELQLVEMIVVHELAHLSVKNHSEHFYALMGKAMPDHRQRRALLKNVAWTLPL